MFDSGAKYSFISVELVETLGLIPTDRPLQLSVILLDRKSVKFEELYENCPIWMYEHWFLADLYMIELTDFGVILGLVWLAKY